MIFGKDRVQFGPIGCPMGPTFNVLSAPRVRNGLEALADRLPKRTTKSFGECR
jgi:hypothetical protein